MEKIIDVKQVLDFLNRFAPPSLAEDWDNVGLQLGSLDAEVKGILVALDVTEAVLEEARKLKANLLITHHPLIFKPFKNLDDSKVSQRLAKKAIQYDIHILSFHTNLDSTRQGLNDHLAEKLKLQQVAPMIPSKDPKYPQAGMGRIGLLPPLSFSDFLDHLSLSLQLKYFRFVGHPQTPISTVAVVTGSGGDYFAEAKAKGADVLVTGDIKYHAALDATAEGICMVDIGHFPGEIGMTSLVMNQIRLFLKEQKVLIPVYKVSCQRDPFGFYIG